MDDPNKRRRVERGRRSPVSSSSQRDRDTSERDISEASRGTESEGEGLFDDQDRMMADYRPIAELDVYDAAQLDEREFGADPEARMAAERALEARDRMEGRSRVPAALQESEGDESEGEGFRAMRRRRMEAAALGEAYEEDEEFDFEAFTVPLSQWLREEKVQRALKSLFTRFLTTFSDERGAIKYTRLISEMCAANKQSLEVSYVDFMHFAPTPAVWVAERPKQLIPILEEVAMAVVLREFPDYKAIHDHIYVRLAALPVSDDLRSLRQNHLNAMVNVPGVVTRRTGVFPQLKMVRFNCVKCGTISNPVAQTGEKEVKLPQCESCGSKGPFSINSELTVYRNFQRLTLQEPPSSVPAGRMPRSKEVILVGDLIDAARPGEEIDVTGIYTNTFSAGLNSQQGFPVFATVIEANHIAKRHDALSSVHLTEDDISKIHELSRNERLRDILLKTIAPSIYGNDHVKLAVLLAMFGGREKNIANKHRVRGDINVLMLGDPGTAKSQILKYIEKTAPRAVYTTGKGASAVGLTAAVHRDPLTREWTLEGGALVLADRGTCMIDEFDKMNDADRTSIHEAMEQQSISISKAGIVATLQARCSVIAAANPIGGRYDVTKTFSENVTLTDPILQRFDILCVLRDTVDPVVDERLASFVLLSHMKSHPRVREEEEEKQRMESEGVPPSEAGGLNLAGSIPSLADLGVIVNEDDVEAVSQDLLKKYILYAKRHCRPVLTHINQDKIARLYADLRKESELSNGIPIAVRHIESIIRMAEAHAKMHLRQTVTDVDVDVAIRVILTSFTQAQKYAVMRSLQRAFRRYLVSDKDYNSVLLFALQEMVREANAIQALRGGADLLDEVPVGRERITVSLDELQKKAQSLGATSDHVRAFLQSPEFTSHRFSLDDSRKVIIKEF